MPSGPWGFAPEPTVDGKEVFFLRVREVADVVCAVHLGIMQGVLAELRSPAVTATRLEPFVEPHGCVAHLGKARRSRTKTN